VLEMATLPEVVCELLWGPAFSPTPQYGSCDLNAPRSHVLGT
jgi:hypothetical protein